MIAWHGRNAASRPGGDRRAGARGVSLRPPTALHGRGRSLPSCARPLERLGRSPTMREFAADPRGGAPPADGDRALRHVERSQTGRRAFEPRRYMSRGGAARTAARARGGARSVRRPPRHRGAPRQPGFEVARSGTRSGRSRRPSREAGFDVPVGEGGSSARSRDGAVLARRARPTPEDGGLEGRATARRDAALGVAGLPHGGRAAEAVVGVPVPRRASGCAKRASGSRPTGRCSARGR